MKKSFILTWMLVVVISAVAQQQLTARMKAVATSILRTDVDKLDLVMEKQRLAVVTNGREGFVIMTKGEDGGEVLGYSETPFITDSLPPALEWWMKKVDSTLCTGQRLKMSQVPSQLQQNVQPLLKTKWGQGSPYNMKCPIDPTTGERSLTGCTATALAQIMNYYKSPLQGTGTISYKYWFFATGDTVNISYDFSSMVLEWENIKNSYNASSTLEQKRAVATLMFACGVMAHSCFASSQTPGYPDDAYKNLSCMSYRSFPLLWRKYYGDDIWITKIYRSLSHSRPVLYGGGGHAFVLDGYKADGMIHVNWGWYGDCDGYFNINALNAAGYNYNSSEHMCYDIMPAELYKPEVTEIVLQEAGTLSEKLPAAEAMLIDRLKITGNMNGDDFLHVKNLTCFQLLGSLDLSDVNIVAGGSDLVTEENEFPPFLFSAVEPYNMGFHIESLKFPNSMINIGEGALMNCTNLHSLTIPKNVTHIGNYLISLNRLRSINVEEGNTVFDSRDDCNAIVKTAEDEIIFGCKETHIPKSVRRIGYNAFTSLDIENIDFPEGPEGVEEIAGWAFSHCHRLTSVKFPVSLHLIEEGAFSSCENLEKVYISKGLSQISPRAFEGSQKLNRIIVDGQNSVLDSREDCNAIINTANNELILGCRTSLIPSSVRRIGDHAFVGIFDFKSITIPEGVEEIGIGAFGACYDLQSVLLPQSLKVIEERAFQDNSFTSISLPEGLKNIGAGAFSGCYNLSSITLPAGLEQYDWALAWCDGLKNVILPKNMDSISEGMFSWCRGLTNFTIPSSVSSIGRLAFNGCDGLTSLIIGNNVTTIGDAAFAGCIKLDSVYSYIQKPFYIDDNTFVCFDETTQQAKWTMATLYVPEGTMKDYKSTPFWNLFQTIEEIDMSSIHPVIGSKLQVPTGYYDLKGRRRNTHWRGQNIIYDKDGNIKKVFYK